MNKNACSGWCIKYIYLLGLKMFCNEDYFLLRWGKYLLNVVIFQLRILRVKSQLLQRLLTTTSKNPEGGFPLISHLTVWVILNSFNSKRQKKTSKQLELLLLFCCCELQVPQYCPKFQKAKFNTESNHTHTHTKDR